MKRLLSNFSVEILDASRVGDGPWWLDENGVNYWNRKDTFPFNAIYLVKKGEFNLTINGTKHRIGAHQLVFIPEGSELIFDFDGKNMLEKYFTHFHLEIGARNLAERFELPQVFKPKDEESIEKLFRELIKLRETADQPAAQIAMSATLLSMISHILVESDAKYNEKSTPITEEMVSAVEYLERHIAEPVAIGALAERFGYSTAYFTKKFKNVFGRTPTEYIAEQKIRFAKEKLRTTGMTIAEIGQSLGFSDASYFSSFFKMRTGLAPAFYRKDEFMTK